MDFSINPLILGGNDVMSCLLLAPGITLTPNGVLKEVRNQVAWSEYIRNHTQIDQLNIDLKPGNIFN